MTPRKKPQKKAAMPAASQKLTTKNQRRRSVALAIALITLAGLFFFVTIVKLGGQVMERAL